MNNLIESAIYIVSTPIGNLEDITIRALKVLNSVDFIACEDTRHSGLLLQKLEIKYNKLISYHDFNESEKSNYIINLVLDGNSVALISDAGTPLISDPGFKLIDKAIAANIKIIPVPGVSSVITALSASGMSVHSFTFLGFPPQKKGRMTFLKNAVNYDTTVILFESNHRIEKLIEELEIYAGKNRKICIARELTKIHEEFIRGSISEVNDFMKNKNGMKGEIVVIIEPSNKQEIE